MTPLPVYLERVDAEKRMSRFYTIRVERTLFGEWAVIYQWGRIGARGQRQEQWMVSFDDAARVADRKLHKKTAGGYSIKNERPREISDAF